MLKVYLNILFVLCTDIIRGKKGNMGKADKTNKFIVYDNCRKYDNKLIAKAKE